MAEPAVTRFPPRRAQAVFLLPERLGGWLVILREYGWHFGSRRDAVLEALQLARRHDLRALEWRP